MFNCVKHTTYIMWWFACALIAGSLPLALASCAQYEKSNVFIGTGGLAYGYGGINPGVSYPSGALRLGPDTTDSVADIGYRHFSGYNYQDGMIRAFSHTHLVGAGINDLGFFGAMPTRVTRDFNHEDDLIIWSGINEKNLTVETRAWWSPFQKSNENGLPGQYNCTLDKPKVNVNLLATSTLTAIHKYTFLSEESNNPFSPGIVLDVCHAAQITEGIYRDSTCRDAKISISDDLTSFTASVYFSNKFYIYIYGEFSEAASEWRTCSNEAGLACTNGLVMVSDNGILFSRVLFGKSRRESIVELRVALSFISADQARLNFKDLKHASFELSRLQTTEAWCSVLNKMEISPLDGDEDIEHILHSANYRIALTPAIYTEAGGVYLGIDKEIHSVNERNYSNSPSANANEYYSDYSFWDTFRSLHPYILLVDEAKAVGILRSVGEMTVQNQGYPKWVMQNVDIGCMVGLHGASIALEGCLSGFSDEFDLLAIQQMLLNQDTLPWPKNQRTDLDFYLSNGYVSAESDEAAAALTLTYAFDDYVLAGLSKCVNDMTTHDSSLKRSQNYRNIFSSKEYACPRSTTGEFLCPDNPIGPKSWQSFIEGNTLHWTPFVIHDPLGLISLYESHEDFDLQLESFFVNHIEYHNKFGSAVPNPYYWAGNEVTSFSVWLFNYGDKCTLTQYWSRNITHLHFSSTPHGVPGNEDYGAMASWVLLASIGIYPQASTTNYLIGSPRVKEARLTLEHLDGAVSYLEILTYNNSDENVYVEKLLVNGQAHTSTVIDRTVLSASSGCKLEFFMTSTPVSSLC